MNFNHFKIAFILLLGSLLVVYTNCGQPFSAPSELVFKSNVYGGGSEASYNAFEQTVYPITRANCISCHAEDIQPHHAHDDVKKAHDAVISGFKVNFSNIPASRLVAKLRNENHNCWSNCSDNANEMIAAIEEWNNAIKDSGVDQTPVDTAIYTDETDTMEVEFGDINNPLKSNTIKLNIESAMLVAPMTLTRPNDGDPYLSVPTNLGTTLTATDSNAGRALMNFKVPANGAYRVWGLVHGPADADNSFFLSVVNQGTTTSVSGGVRTWDIPVGARAEWRQLPNVSMNLTTTGTYTLELRQREDGARLSGLIITSDTNFNGQEVGDFFGITLSFDLSAQLKTPNVRFLIDVIDYDLYSWKFSRPRIVSSTANVYAKGLKIYVNDSFTPQHATYTIVDKIVTPQDPALSPYSMIVVKDRGNSSDHVKFSFDQLVITNAGSTGASVGGATGGTSPQTSLQAFIETVYPVSRSSTYTCVNCHTGVAPRHSSDNTLTAHDAALTVVDFNNPQNSRIVNKMRVERHNCGAQCDNIANLYQNAIIEWRTRRQ